MDPVTHGILGAAVSQALFGKKLGKKAWLLGCLAAMVPDLDVLIRSGSDPLLYINYHRQFTHALIFAPLGGLIVGLLWLALTKIHRPQWRWAILAAVCAYATHGMLDALTSYGTVLLWPFSNQRYVWDTISIIDPVFMLVLLIGVIWSARTLNPKPVRVALLLSALYLAFGAWQHHRAILTQQYLLQENSQTSYQSRVMPTLGNLFFWRSLYVVDDQIHFDMLSVLPMGKLKSPSFSSAMSLYQYHDLPLAIQKDARLTKDFELFHWFSDGLMTAFSYQPLIIVDARYLLPLEPL
ncbi:MAG: metal-dependent hydrolase, partial [Gammaproteobacteria bacterium]